MCLVVEALNGGILDRAVHALGLTIGPWVLGLCETMIDTVYGTGVFESMGSEGLAISDRLSEQRYR